MKQLLNTAEISMFNFSWAISTSALDQFTWRNVFGRQIRIIVNGITRYAIGIATSQGSSAALGLTVRQGDRLVVKVDP